jgi:phosphoribosylamine---glycine ligase
MNVLFISKDMSGGGLCHKLKKEGNDVRIFIEDENHRHHYSGIIEKVEHWENQLDWVGKDGLIIFDSVGYGEIQDALRKNGYSVVGGCVLGDKLEHDRQYGQKISAACDIPHVPSINFKNPEDAIEFVRNNKGPWVLKQNGHVDKVFNYVSDLEDGSDMVDVLDCYRENDKKACESIDLQKRIIGVEIGVGRYFNGKDWIGPIEMNIEHKPFFPGGIGPKTYEMGTLTWYEKNEKNKLFVETLGKLKPFLQQIDFRGDVDINCIVNEDGVFPLEITARFGWPSTQLQMELHESPWGEFLKAVADGKEYDLKYKKGYGIVVLVATPPFPYGSELKKHSTMGVRIRFKENFTDSDMEHVFLEEVSLDKKGRYYISGDSGFVLHVTGSGKTVKKAQKMAYGIIDKIIIPKMYYRNDIGSAFANVDKKKLKKWGWI